MAIQINKASTDIHHRILDGIQNGSIRTWQANDDGSIFHTGESNQWAQCARLIPTGTGLYKILIFEHERCTNKSLAQIYGVYHGRFIEMLLSHFNCHFETAYATAQPHSFDRFQRRNRNPEPFSIEEPR